MIGIAKALPAMSALVAARLDRAMAPTDVSAPALAAQTELLATRDTLLALVEARA